MKILITGALGFIGRAALDHFSEEHHVMGIDLKALPAKNIFAHQQFSITKALIKEAQFDVIINCAGSSNVSQSFQAPEHDFNLNTVLVQNILCELQQFSPNTKFLQLSSAAVYGNPQTLPVKELDRTKPLSPYGEHKLLSEQIVTSYANFFGIRGLSVRIFSAYGPGLRRQFFSDLYTKFESDKHQVLLSGTGEETRDFILVYDIVKAFDMLIKNASFNGEIYNLASETEIRIRDAAVLFASIYGYHGKISFTEKQLEGYPLNWKADMQKLKALGFATSSSIEEGLELYFNWIKNHKAS